MGASDRDTHAAEVGKEGWKVRGLIPEGLWRRLEATIVCE